MQKKPQGTLGDVICGAPDPLPGARGADGSGVESGLWPFLPCRFALPPWMPGPPLWDLGSSLGEQFPIASAWHPRSAPWVGLCGWV